MQRTHRHRHSHRHLGVTAAVGIGLLALSGCSSSDGTESTAADPAATTALAVDLGEVITEAPVEPEVSSSGGGGSCTVEATGATDFAFTTSGGPATIASTHWFPVDSAGYGATPALVLNCDAGDGTLVALSIDSIDDLAFAPGTYDVPSPSTAVAVTTTGQFWAPTGAVALQLDSFDAAGISGTTSFEAADASGATVSVNVTFDLENPVPV